ncbi:response regulator transcription factor [Maribacter sp. MJ134]|uniref:LytR/AlgR family response regulator transcription factor n=1 Tax=Maribacter sp. MJ134 TaxID=2496865 RepID=UPI000F819FEB|nr:LytTR family DNA-binding domain-containing protein [Maribacter sp. MJ134]AZQ58112.1 response regulator transcription factor [Maribacter sp. MJ134]
MKKLQCIIADDEPIARQILERYIEEVPHLELIGSCKDAFEVMEMSQKRAVDLLFLDINMPKLSGLSLLKTMRNKPEVIITTAYAAYAVEGFELEVRDYLLKPFSFERFYQAVLKVQKEEQPSNINQVTVKESPDFIFVKSDKKIIKLMLSEISHIEAYGNYVKIYTDTRILSAHTLTDFLKKLSDDFIRIHKSYVINFNHLRLIDGNQIILENELKFPIGKSYRKAILDKI